MDLDIHGYHRYLQIITDPHSYFLDLTDPDSDTLKKPDIRSVLRPTVGLFASPINFFLIRSDLDGPQNRMF